jgi:glycosyltransferase involved in cell wall biosynthesis
MHELYQKYASKRIILSHDWLTGMRGGEKVLELLCENFPQAELYTLIHNPDAVTPLISQHVRGTSFLQHVPRIQQYYRYALPLFPTAIRHIKTPPADLLISTSHCVAKGLPIHPQTRHLCYCFTPMRYAWVFYDEYFGENRLKKVFLKPILDKIRAWDLEKCQKVDRFVAISHHIRHRIEKYYNREADVVYPPVDTLRLVPPSRPAQANYDLIVSALVPYKRIDLAVEAYKNIDFQLKIVGTGTEFEKLRQNAPKNVEFIGWESNERIKWLYQNCRCLVFPGEEDFGIVPVEVQACGRPVVAYARGGALETVENGLSGIFFDQQTSESLEKAIEKCAKTVWNPENIRKNALKFSTENFLTGLSRSIEAC